MHIPNCFDKFFDDFFDKCFDEFNLTYLSSKKNDPQCDIRISSVSVVNVPLSNAHPLTIMVPLPSARKKQKAENLLG